MITITPEQGKTTPVDLTEVGERGPFDISYRIKSLEFSDGGSYIFRYCQRSDQITNAPQNNSLICGFSIVVIK